MSALVFHFSSQHAKGMNGSKNAQPWCSILAACWLNKVPPELPREQTRRKKSSELLSSNLHWGRDLALHTNVRLYPSSSCDYTQPYVILHVTLWKRMRKRKWNNETKQEEEEKFYRIRFQNYRTPKCLLSIDRAGFMGVYLV